MEKSLKQQTLDKLIFNDKEYSFYNLNKLTSNGKSLINTIPYSKRVLIEDLIRNIDGKVITDEHVFSLLGLNENNEGEVPFKPSRVILQDFTGVPTIVDLAAMRDAIVKKGGDPSVINPEIPVDLVIDHSVQVDNYGTADSLILNEEKEYERNRERYEFLKWAQNSFDNFKAVPPATGIVHQVNLEYLAPVVMEKEVNGINLLYPDSVVGTDSHTTMINGLGVLGWGVGGIEAEACMLGEPSYFTVPEVIGVKLNGELNKLASATDLALTVTNVLRKSGVVGKFVEFYGSGLNSLTLADRATIANMAPEYGATCGYFPIDNETLNYLLNTGRNEENVKLIKEYLSKSGLFYSEVNNPEYNQVIEIDLNNVVPSVSGPKRPQDLITLPDVKEKFKGLLTTSISNGGYGLSDNEATKKYIINTEKDQYSFENGSIFLAAITSCTNTSNPYLLLAAGMLAKNAIEKGLSIPSYVKTSLAPGSKVVTEYLNNSGLQTYLDQLGFNIVGYGCTTCIGNSGPLNNVFEEFLSNNDIIGTSILSGNRNFEGRVHPLIKANFLASPALVVAYALAGRITFDFDSEPLAVKEDGSKVFLKDIYPSSEEIFAVLNKYVNKESFSKVYESVYLGNENWNNIPTLKSSIYKWDDNSTYIKNPPYFDNMDSENKPNLTNLRVIGLFGDSVTTDHISPAGNIKEESPAGFYLKSLGVPKNEFNSYGSRRGNHEVMMRGTFANIRIRNKIANGKEGGYTTFWPRQEVMSVYDAAMEYVENGIGTIIFAGKDYGMGSSRDWAAKGTKLLGIRAVVAESFERIHRSNLALMGVLPLEFTNGENADALGIDGSELISINIPENITPKQVVSASAQKTTGEIIKFNLVVRFDSDIEIDFYKNNGILPFVVKQKLN
ncbi:MAG: aconitate hydratase 1 [Bacillales bacterium]|jgi:aconitate hydratase|nr:aconitate hydratase 1 [Bacillales bacterium]